MLFEFFEGEDVFAALKDARQERRLTQVSKADICNGSNAHSRVHNTQPSNVGAPSNMADSSKDGGRTLDAMSSLSIGNVRLPLTAHIVFEWELTATDQAKARRAPAVPYAERPREHSPCPANVRVGKSSHSSMMPLHGDSRPVASTRTFSDGQSARSSSLIPLGFEALQNSTGECDTNGIERNLNVILLGFYYCLEIVRRCYSQTTSSADCNFSIG